MYESSKTPDTSTPASTLTSFLPRAVGGDSAAVEVAAFCLLSCFLAARKAFLSSFFRSL